TLPAEDLASEECLLDRVPSGERGPAHLRERASEQALGEVVASERILGWPPSRPRGTSQPREDSRDLLRVHAEIRQATIAFEGPVLSELRREHFGELELQLDGEPRPWAGEVRVQ